jgi:hypothetical protein
MAEKNVVLCEGIHDLILISLLLEKKEIRYDKITHEELVKPKQRSPESNKIRDFLKTINKSYKYLIKDEGGYPRCIDNFLYLYQERSGDEYTMYLILDDGKPLTKLKTDSVNRFHKDILDKQSENFYLTKDKWKHRVFIIPISLESQVQSVTGKNLDFNNRDEIKDTLNTFIDQCLTLKVDWFIEFQTVLLS